MNAILSVSLALARAVAHIQGKELYGLIREESFSIIESLAKDYQVQIKSKEVSDYIAALREVNQILEKQNQPLYEALREKTKIYAVLSSSPDSAKPREDFAYFGWTDEQIDRQLAKDAARGIHPEEPRTSEEKAYLERERDIAFEHLRLKGIIRSRPPKVLVIYTDELAFGATYKPEENFLLFRSPLINHPKYNLTAVFVHELNGGSQQENEAAELAYAISQDIQESYGVTPEYIRIETQLGPGGRNRGSTILLKAVSVSSGEILRIYLEKNTHGTTEVERSIRASRLGLGPKVIYVRGNTIVEYYAGKDTDLRQRGLQLTSQEQQIVGMRERSFQNLKRLIEAETATAAKSV